MPRFRRIAILERREDMKLLSADDMREFINQRKPTTPEVMKKFMANEEEGGKIGLEQAKEIREYVEEGIKDMKKDK